VAAWAAIISGILVLGAFLVAFIAWRSAGTATQAAERTAEAAERTAAEALFARRETQVEQLTTTLAEIADLLVGPRDDPLSSSMQRFRRTLYLLEDVPLAQAQDVAERWDRGESPDPVRVRAALREAGQFLGRERAALLQSVAPVKVVSKGMVNDVILR
jgi:protein-tyrosine-phosphatase